MKRIRARRLVVSRNLAPGSPAHDRAMRVASRIDAQSTQQLSSAEIRALQMSLNRDPPKPPVKRAHGHELIILDRMRWVQKGSLSPGYDWAETRSGSYQWQQHGVVCQTAVEIQTIFGCLFDCGYCPYTRSVTIACDLEAFEQRVRGLLAGRPKQLLYKLNNRSDTLCFEPEYGLSRKLVELFAERAEQRLMLYSKSDNVSHLLDLDHGGHTIACFTLSTPTVARLLEPAAPSFDARLDAAARCAHAGYPVRFRFSPIVPFRGWQQEAVAAVQRMAQRVRPELITLWTLSMTDADTLETLVDPATLDPRFLDGLRGAQAAMTGVKGAPFPPDARREMYEVFADAVARYSPTTRVALCLETQDVIEALRPRLAITGNAQVCNCGPRCTSGAVEGAPAAANTVPRGRLTRREPSAAPRLSTQLAAQQRRHGVAVGQGPQSKV